MVNLIQLQRQYKKQRKFYKPEEKQAILKYIPRFDPPKKKNVPNPFKPTKEQYVKDLIHIMEHIFSYEFKTEHLD